MNKKKLYGINLNPDLTRVTPTRLGGEVILVNKVTALKISKSSLSESVDNRELGMSDTKICY